MNSKIKLLIGILVLLVVLTALFASAVFAAPPWISSPSQTTCGQQYCRGANGESCQASCQGTCDGDCEGTCQGNCEEVNDCCGPEKQQVQGNNGCRSNQGCGGVCARGQ